MKIARPPATNERSRLDGEPTIAQIKYGGAVWWNIVEREILPNNFPRYVGSESLRVLVRRSTHGSGRDFIFGFHRRESRCRSSDLAFKTALFAITATVNRAIRNEVSPPGEERPKSLVVGRRSWENLITAIYCRTFNGAIHTYRLPLSQQSNISSIRYLSILFAFYHWLK